MRREGSGALAISGSTSEPLEGDVRCGGRGEEALAISGPTSEPLEGDVRCSGRREELRPRRTARSRGVKMADGMLKERSRDKRKRIRGCEKTAGVMKKKTIRHRNGI